MANTLAPAAVNHVMNGSAKAWIIFAMGSGNITNDFNFSSVTDVTTGVYSISMTNAFDSAAYTVSAGGSDESAGPVSYVQHSTRNAGDCRVYAVNRSGSAFDSSHWEGCFHGDLA